MRNPRLSVLQNLKWLFALNNASLDISVVGRAALVENASSFVFS
jgi:hypothetical protein